MSAGPTGLENVTIADRAFWLDEIDDPQVREWIVACEAIDQRGETAPLLMALRQCIPAAAFRHVADLFDRYELKKRRGRPRCPSYDLSAQEARLACAIAEVEDALAPRKRLRAQFKRDKWQVPLNKDEVIERVARAHAIPVEVLISACAGKRGATRRMKQRRTKIESD
ncbi:hypothetical protein LG047_08940 [Methylocystis sp. WRRC1]|uniref:hypothetical protein n=1 Tax=Methylocystis sp. WRRC1 TaxID=1732014 RepID=UPI001D14C353|nr:hypothetical protein [Methylocystis sp. WRRC1]MCC3245445.1 hypothetical protein [Methylocystis sp. WRRC1]